MPMFTPAEVTAIAYEMGLPASTSPREVLAAAAVVPGGAAQVLADLDAYGPSDGPSCSICDALGHGYPGGPPCPLEGLDPIDPIEEALMAMDPQTNGEFHAWCEAQEAGVR